ncbi:hypothetical protein [Olivibacter sitiensis]|uniref:hypothetical protein n=1 Tax=Olivibacter sitiensis TaxID=376470 RepID=UPI0004181149|nr:hypothetical protein [Olivibacter sitiensis]
MKRYLVLERTDREEFELDVNAACLEGAGSVVASNVYVFDRQPVYYALIEKSDVHAEQEILTVAEESNYRDTNPESSSMLN